ncbi:MAG: hypothetical protein Q8K70_06845 [Bacteroidota bacterium]|nr:hypothetical protein [Bacteroidota bacterium]
MKNVKTLLAVMFLLAFVTSCGGRKDRCAPVGYKTNKTSLKNNVLV